MTDTATETDEKKTPDPGTGWHDQTFLVGEHIYLRTVTEADAAYGSAWMFSHMPKSTVAVEAWIEDDLKDADNSTFLLIIRKDNDQPVGAVEAERWQHARWLEGRIDPLLGEQGQGFLGEAYSLLLPWLIDEQQCVIANVTNVPDDHVIVQDMLISAGAREATSFRQNIKRGSTFIDSKSYEYVNKDWIRTLGDPADVVLERTGTGQPRPVIAPVTIEHDLPRNAMRVGPRVYLRPLQKDDAKLIANWARRETEPFWSSGRGVATTTSIEQWFEGLQKNEPQEWVRFAVCLRENDEFIGAVGIDGIDYINRCAESESEFHNVEYRSKGYGTEAKHLLFDYAFNTLGLHTLQSWVMYSNTRSAAALRKQGYRETGRESWLVRKAGNYENFATFELLADEWRAMPRASVEDAGDLAGD